MKRFIVFLKLIFVLPTMFFTRLHLRKSNLEGKLQITKIWANYILRSASVRLEIENTNLIPLEDGYTFISNHPSKYDGLFILAANPLTFSFFIPIFEKLPYMTPFLKMIESIRYTAVSQQDDLIFMSQELSKHRNFHLYVDDLIGNEVDSSILDAAFLTKTAIIPVAISNAKSMMKLGFHKIKISYCTPLHYEEYGSLGARTTIEEIKTRINNEIKQGDK